jgi:hypothetical protein
MPSSWPIRYDLRPVAVVEWVSDAGLVGDVAAGVSLLCATWSACCVAPLVAVGAGCGVLARRCIADGMNFEHPGKVRATSVRRIIVRFMVVLLRNVA